MLTGTLLFGVALAQEVKPGEQNLAADPAMVVVPGGLSDSERLALLESQVLVLSRNQAQLHEELSRQERRLLSLQQAETVQELGEAGLGRTVEVPADAEVSQAVSYAGTLHIRGHVMGDAVSLGGDVVVHPGGLVGGDAVSLAGHVKVEDGGRVVGNRVNLGGVARAQQRHSAWREFLRRGARRLGMSMALAAGGILLVALFPKPVDASARALTNNPRRCLLTGLGATLLALSGSALMALTLIGLPLALVMLVALFAAWALGFVGTCQALGDRLPLRTPGAGRWLAFLGGVTLLGMLTALPWPAWVVTGAFGALGVGAVIRGRQSAAA